MKYLIISLLLFSCAKPEYRMYSLIQENEITPYVKTFENLGKYYYGESFTTYGISYMFADWGYNNIAGLCEYRGNERKISLNMSYWKDYSDVTREMLVFHEFGHCKLNRGHLETEDEFGVPVSIMYHEILSEFVYSLRRDYYIDELFTGE